MHPARSVILFTTLSGLGFGLLAWLGLGLPTVTGWSAFAFFSIPFALANDGELCWTGPHTRPLPPSFCGALCPARGSGCSCSPSGLVFPLPFKVALFSSFLVLAHLVIELLYVFW